MDFGRAFLIAMATAGLRLTAKQTAKKLDISVNYLYDIYNNKKRPSLKLLIKLSKMCNTKLSTVIAYAGE